MERRSSLLFLTTLTLIILLGIFAGACGGDETATSTSSSLTASSETTQADVDSSTTTLTDSSSTTAAQTSATTAATTTTTVKVTTTTAKATTTTAKATTTTKKTTTTVKPTTTTVKGKIVLTLIGPSGTKELSMADLKAMNASSGYGGWKNQLGNITGPTSYKGVRITALMELVGGGGSVRVTASDGYEQTLSASELAGEVNLYDPTSGEQITSISGSVKAILAYSKGGGAIGSGDGPLRIVFVSPEKDQVTDSAMWVKMVTSIKVN